MQLIDAILMLDLAHHSGEPHRLTHRLFERNLSLTGIDILALPRFVGISKYRPSSQSFCSISKPLAGLSIDWILHLLP